MLSLGLRVSSVENLYILVIILFFGYSLRSCFYFVAYSKTLNFTNEIIPTGYIALANNVLEASEEKKPVY